MQIPPESSCISGVHNTSPSYIRRISWHVKRLETPPTFYSNFSYPSPFLYAKYESKVRNPFVNLGIQGDSGGICTTLGNDSMSDSKQKSSYEHGSDFERLRSYDRLNLE